MFKRFLRSPYTWLFFAAFGVGLLVWAVAESSNKGIAVESESAALIQVGLNARVTSRVLINTGDTWLYVAEIKP